MAARFITYFCVLFLVSKVSSRSLTAAGTGNVFNEQLQSQGLLGAHFGNVDIPKSYDYIIIGGGTAGLTVAHRLAKNHTVAVIEAGSFPWIDSGSLSQIPADASYYLGKDPQFKNPRIDWGQMTTTQAGLEGKAVLFPQGRTLGGGSTRNFMWYQRGTMGSYQMWADETGDESYRFPKFLQYFQKSISFTPPNASGRAANSTPQFNAADYSPGGGPLRVAYPNFASPVASWIARGLDAIGLSELPGLVDGNLLGWTWIANTIHPITQIRSTSETSFLRESMTENANLVIYSSTIAKKILFDTAKRATGVLVENSNFNSGRTAYTLNAMKEVIVSSGTFRSRT
jgi:choline dehydrogenase